MEDRIGTGHYRPSTITLKKESRRTNICIYNIYNKGHRIHFERDLFLSL